ADRAVGVVDEVPQADQRHLVAAVDGGAREPDGGVVVLLGGHVVDHEAELDRFHWAGSFWNRFSTGVVRQRSRRASKSGSAKYRGSRSGGATQPSAASWSSTTRCESANLPANSGSRSPPPRR